jgi:hypothetical protein
MNLLRAGLLETYMESLRIVKSDATELWLEKISRGVYQNCGNFEIVDCHVEGSGKSFSMLIVTMA